MKIPTNYIRGGAQIVA